jgi:predicted transcriptional regulator YdeE
MQTIKSFQVIGIAVRTTNENGQSGQDIGALWNRFMSDDVMTQIPDKTDDTIYCIYTEYEKDFTRPYTTILGCKVNSLDHVPAGMVSVTITIKEDNYVKFVAKGSLLEGAVFNEWTKIWNSGMTRAYTVDFEVYGEKAKNPADAEVDIFISV